MTSDTRAVSRQAIAFCLAGIFAISSVSAARAQQSPPAAAGQQQSGNPQNGGAQTNNNSLPDAPTASQAGSTQSSTTAKPQNSGQQPVGTAAAGIENTAGVAASKPAGVAIAPPKQRRVRMLVIKVGAIVGAGAALGAVVGLTKASPSHPPGAH